MKQITLLFVAVLYLLCTACASDPRPFNPLTEKPPGDPSLARGEDGTYVNFAKRGVLRQYEAFFVEPITFMNEDKGRLTTSSGREVRDLTSSFRNKIIRALGSRHTNFNQPAKNVAIIRVKVLDVWSTRAVEALRPGILIPNNLGGGATMEALFIDSVSGKEVGRVWDSRPGQRQGFMTGLTKWGGTKAAFDEWAELLNRSISTGAYA